MYTVKKFGCNRQQFGSDNQKKLIRLCVKI